MKLRYSREATAEIRLASARYEGQRPGFGDQFIDAVNDTARQIAEWPSAGQPFDDFARGRIVRRFPYWLVYEQRGSVIVVTAVAHQSRGDDYWRSRGGVREPSVEYLRLAA